MGMILFLTLFAAGYITLIIWMHANAEKDIQRVGGIYKWEVSIVSNYELECMRKEVNSKFSKF